jgi:hypothetical protein
MAGEWRRGAQTPLPVYLCLSFYVTTVPCIVYISHVYGGQEVHGLFLEIKAEIGSCDWWQLAEL